MQAAAQTALPTGETKAAAASTKSGLGPNAHGKARLHGLPFPAQKPAAAGSGRLGAAIHSKQKAFPLLEALQKALSAGTSAHKHGKASSAAGTAAHARPSLSANAGAAHALVAAAGLQKDAAAAAPAAEAPAPGKKKTAAAQHGSTSAEAAALALARELLKNFPVAAAASKSPETPGQAREIQTAAQGIARVKADPKIHVIDARHRKAEHALDDALKGIKPQHAAGAEKDAPPAIAHKPDSGRDTAVLEPRKAQPSAAGPFAGALDRLRDMAGSELVRATGIVIRDGGGEIKLVLKPESLGSVRIRMNLVDNAIEGRIIVDNAAVKQVFDGNIDSLMRALTAEGFQTASLQVSVGGQNAHNGKPEEEALPRVRRVGARDFERNVPGIETMSLDDLLVNLFA